MLEIKTAKTRKGKRELEKRAPKLVTLHPSSLSLSLCFPRKSLHFPGKSFFAGGIGEEDADPARNEDQRRAERRAGADLSPEEGLCRQVQPQERERQALRGRRRDFA